MPHELDLVAELPGTKEEEHVTRKKHLRPRNQMGKLEKKKILERLQFTDFELMFSFLMCRLMFQRYK